MLRARERYGTMHALLATGVPPLPSVGHGAFDWSPFLMALAALVVAPIVFGIGLTTRSTASLVIGGILLGWLGASMGVVPAVSLGLLGLALASEWLRRSRIRRYRAYLELPD